MRFPVDSSALAFVSAGPAVPAIEYDTKAQKLDTNGVPVNQVDLFAVGDGSREVITVQKDRSFEYVVWDISDTTSLRVRTV